MAYFSLMMTEVYLQISSDPKVEAVKRLAVLACAEKRLFIISFFW